ncbi:MAG: hypothetical protein L6264_05065 [Weeksellaceae bacterium]|nr:hypothetical protein [Bacteroidota bacterium]MCG2780300.1 hypothetical protein [Weeksellaceae bacterium]
MKHLIFIISFLILFSCNKRQASEEKILVDKTASVSKTDGNSQVPEKKLKTVDDIKASYAYFVNKLRTKGIDSTLFKYNCNNEKSGKVIYFTENGKLRMIRHAYSEYSHFSATDEYFVEDDSVYFIYSKQVQWNFVDQNKTKDEIIERRIYIIDNNPVKCLENESTLIVSSGKSGTAKAGSNKEMDCSSFQPMLKQFEKLIKLRGQKKDMECLE